MKRIVCVIAVLWLCPAPAMGRLVFFDDFEGNALLPHWNLFDPPNWEHDVSNSMLNVTALLSPSHPKSPGNFDALGAAFEPQADFRLDVWMGWEAGQAPHRLTVNVGGPFSGSPIIARMGYRNEFPGDPVILAGPGNAPPLTLPAPTPGIHHFTITRTSAQFDFYLNGSAVASFPDNFGTPAASVWFDFVGPYPGNLGAFHIDRVQVVPIPGTLFLTAAFGFGCAGRRRGTATSTPDLTKEDPDRAMSPST